MIEIERKFLINSDSYKKQADTSVKIIQGYLSTNPNCSVRVRICGQKGVITVKGPSSKNGYSRFEWEHNIALEEAKSLMNLCQSNIIEKTRYIVNFKGRVFEVDEFEGNLAGLTIAEIELDSENDVFEKPQWLGQEVTGKEQYYNAYLSKSIENS